MCLNKEFIRTKNMQATRRAYAHQCWCRHTDLSADKSNRHVGPTNRRESTINIHVYGHAKCWQQYANEVWLTAGKKSGRHVGRQIGVSERALIKVARKYREIEQQQSVGIAQSRWSIGPIAYAALRFGYLTYSFERCVYPRDYRPTFTDLGFIPNFKL